MNELMEVRGGNLIPDLNIDHSSRHNGSRFSRWFAIGVLLFAVWLVASAWIRTEMREPLSEPIGNLIPHTLDGWTVADLPLGRTEAVSNAAERTLQYDDYVYRRFSRGDLSFSIYIAYWAPDKMTVGEVAKHTPDNCWPLNGIPRLSAQNRIIYNVGGIELKEGEQRLFGAGEERIHVIYWHLVNGKIIDHAGRLGWSLHGFQYWADSIKRLLIDGRAEQYLVRVDSVIPIDDLLQEPSFATAFGELKNILAQSVRATKSMTQRSKSAG